MIRYSYGHLLVITGYFSGIIHFITGISGHNSMNMNFVSLICGATPRLFFAWCMASADPAGHIPIVGQPWFCLDQCQILTGAKRRVNGWVAGGCWDDDITSDYGSCPHSLRLATVRIVWSVWKVHKSKYFWKYDEMPVQQDSPDKNQWFDQCQNNSLVNFFYLVGPQLQACGK